MRTTVLWIGLGLSCSGCLAGVKKSHSEAVRAWEATPAWATSGPNLELDTLDPALLVDEVLRRNPNIEAARQAWRAALDVVPQAAAPPDPMLMLQSAPLSWDPDVRFGGGAQVTQSLPFPGSLHQRASAALARAEAAQLDYEQARLEMAHTALMLLARLYVIEQSQRINAEHIALLGELRQIATVRFTAGEATMAAPLMASTELGHLQHKAAVLNSQRNVVRAQINALLHRGPDAPLPPAPERLDAPTPVDDDHTRPDVAMLEAQVEAARAGEALSRLSRLPNLQLGTLYSSMWPMATHRWMVSVGLSVPLQLGSHNARVREARAKRQQMEARLLSGRDRAATEEYIANQRVTEEAEIIRVFEEDVLPSARNRVTAARSGFESGRNSFIDTIDAQKTLLNDELGYRQALAAHFQRQADLALARGQIGVSK